MFSRLGGNLNIMIIGSMRRLATAIGVWLCLFSPIFVRGQAIDSSIERFKQWISAPPKCFTVEFLEGNIDSSPAANSDAAAGVKSDMRHYVATCQDGAFLLDQKEIKTVKEGYFENCGRYGNLVWTRVDNVFARIVDISQHSGGGSLQTTVENVRIGENKVWSAGYFGLPQLDTNTIIWNGEKIQATTRAGDKFEGEILLDDRRAKVAVFNFILQKSIPLFGTVFYSYPNDGDANTLPNVVRRQISVKMKTNAVASSMHLIDQVTFAADTSFNIKILKFEALTNSLGYDYYLSETKKGFYIISNGIPLTKSVRNSTSNFLDAKQLTRYVAPSPIQKKPLLATRIIFLILGLIGIIGFSILARNKTK